MRLPLTTSFHLILYLHSIVDGRYNEQKQRLKACGLRSRLYIVEGQSLVGTSPCISSYHTQSHLIASHHTMAYHIALHYIATLHITLHYIATLHITLHYIISHRTTLQLFTSHYTISYHIVARPHRTTLHRIASHQITSCCTVCLSHCSMSCIKGVEPRVSSALLSAAMLISIFRMIYSDALCVWH